ncbi:MAG: hypothetical protein P8L23_06275, partial [Flavobacteriales bacterium]|nr:hypothetical protein [Flavobacteriales bacterium]
IKWNIYLQKGDQSSVMANRKLHGIVVNYQDLSTESDEENYCNVLNRCRDRHYAKMKEKSKLENILKRNVNNWNNMLLITDCTGSMEPYGAETVLGWLLKLKKNKIKQFSFFNDGDGMAQKDKKIGEVGGVHLVDEINNVQDFINTIRITTILGYGNADEPENDAEAILTSINQTSGFEDVVLIADNNSSVRDKELFEEIMHPVHVILCGVDNDSIEIHKDYILLAYLTNGSIHTVNNDYLNIKSPNTLSK